MVISREFKFIFIHIPKNAGSSISSSLNKCINDKNHWAVSKNTKHQTLLDLIKLKKENTFFKKMFFDFSFLDYYKFAIVRNPYDRMVSLYNYLKKYEVRREINEVNSFEEFIFSLDNDDSWVSKLYSTKPQLDYVIDSEGRIAVDFIGKYEELDFALKEIQKNIGIKFTLNKINQSRITNSDYRQYYNQETKKIVYKKFKKDLDYFDYKF